MNVDTYKSRLVDGVFVTLPSNDRSTLGMVEELSALGLDPVRRAYELPRDEEHKEFARFVLTEIVLKGYATHGGDGSPVTALCSLAHRQPLAREARSPSIRRNGGIHVASIPGRKP